MALPVLDQPWFLGLLVLNSVLGVATLIRDLKTNNPQIAGIMQAVWVLTVLYSGLLGLAVYYYSGRKQIADDSIWRRGFRSVAHCYSGCGAGEIAGITLASAIALTATAGVVALTFSFAYLAGLALTIGPLMSDGMPLGQATKDAIYSESASIVVMEAVAITVDLTLAGEATMADVRFWSSLYLSLAAGLLAAYPVNVFLIDWGVKEGMHDPRMA
jgi:hypothetical protein